MKYHMKFEMFLEHQEYHKMVLFLFFALFSKQLQIA